MITSIEGRSCQYEGCTAPATQIACGRKYLGAPGHPGPGVYCHAHAVVVAEEGRPEYQDNCPNCGCLYGIN